MKPLLGAGWAGGSGRRRAGSGEQGVPAPVTAATTPRGWATAKSCSALAGSSRKVYYLVEHPLQLQGLQAGHSTGSTDITVLTKCVHLSPVTLSPNYGIAKKQVVHLVWSVPTPTHVILELVLNFKKWHVKEEKNGMECV